MDLSGAPLAVAHDMFDIFSDDEKRWCEKTKVKMTVPGAPDYPKAFRNLAIRPHMLTYWGAPVWNQFFCISIVGSRNPSVASLRWLEQELPILLQNKNFVLVSGGARGIDMKTHQMALRCHRPTVVFVPSGLMNIYPPALIDWIEPVVEAGGAVVSQFSPSSQMRREFFWARNRLIAAISELTLVVEAKRRSGTMMTARFVRELNKTLAAVPTFPSAPGLGGLDLIVDGGAFPIRDAGDLSTLAHPFELIQAETQKENIGHPRSNRDGELAAMSEALKSDVKSPINHDRADANHHAAASRGPTVGDSAETHSN